MPEPIVSGEAVPGAGGQQQEIVAGASEQQPSTTPTPPTPSNPQPNQPGTKPQGEDPDYKALYEQSERRRQGLDRRLSQMRGRGNQQSGQPSGEPDPDAEVNELRVFKAESQLKEEAGNILKDYPNIPENVKKAIQRNPRGWIKSTTQTVDDAMLDIEDIARELDEEYSKGTPQPGTKPFQVAHPNATVATQGKPLLENLKTPEEMDAAVKSGQISEKDLADEMRRRARERVNPTH